MISKEEAIAQFKQILGGMSSWVVLAKSQFVEHLSIFSSWALRDALWKLERTKQEFFLSTALNDSSVMAHAEDREYVPRMSTPSTGMVRIVNNGSFVSLAENTAFESNQQINYLLDNAITLEAGATVDIMAAQLTYNSPLVINISETMPFQEVRFPHGISQNHVKFQVSVDIGDGFEPWEYVRLFQNTLATSKVYDLFFSHTGQLGIRFGNDVFGMTPPLNSTIKVECWTTEGDTTLIAGQALQLISDVIDSGGNPADLTITTLDAINGGSGMESIEEMRKNLHYWQRYNEKIVWNDDYAFFVRKQIPSITWFKCWGEGEQEQETGFDVQNINKIFITGYAPNNENLNVDVLAALLSVPLLNRKFQWVDPIKTLFTLTITGTVAKSTDITTAINGIWAVFVANYGPDSTSRVEQIKISDLYELVKKTGYFEGPGAFYQISITGATSPGQLKEMVALDPVLANSSFNLTY